MPADSDRVAGKYVHHGPASPKSLRRPPTGSAYEQHQKFWTATAALAQYMKTEHGWSSPLHTVLFTAASTLSCAAQSCKP